MADNGALITVKGSMGETTHKHHTPTNDLGILMDNTHKITAGHWTISEQYTQMPQQNIEQWPVKVKNYVADRKKCLSILILLYFVLCNTQIIVVAKHRVVMYIEIYLIVVLVTVQNENILEK